MVLKNVLKQGYPFVESIAASLPVCDELLILDGFSTDGTYEVIQKIANLNKKVKVFRQEWPATKKYSVIAEVTNVARAKCSYEYIFSIQANEILHEKNVELFKALPEICPQVNSFSLPFIHLVKQYQFYEDFRLRFAKNIKEIVAIGDAWTMGLSASFIHSQTLKDLAHPKRMLRNVYKGIEWTYTNPTVSPLSRPIYLPKPIYRYWSLFPRDYLEKCEKHVEMFGLTGLKKDVEALKCLVDEPTTFWKKAAEIRRKELEFNYPDALGTVQLGDHPKIVRDLIANSELKSYQVRPEVLDSIKDL
jgi:glycosyltransferase involved in cell wall biosynthesis